MSHLVMSMIPDPENPVRRDGRLPRSSGISTY